MLACELKREAPCAGRGNGLDFDGQGFEARANAGLLFRGDSPMTGCGEEHVAHFDRPQGRDERTPLDHRLAQPVGRFGRFVGEDPRHGKRAAERYRVDAGPVFFPRHGAGRKLVFPRREQGKHEQRNCPAVERTPRAGWYERVSALQRTLRKAAARALLRSRFPARRALHRGRRAHAGHRDPGHGRGRDLFVVDGLRGARRQRADHDIAGSIMARTS